MGSLTLAKGEFPLTIEAMPDGWFVATCRTIPGLFLAGQDLDKIIAESKIVGPILLHHNKHLLNPSRHNRG